MISQFFHFPFFYIEYYNIYCYNININLILGEFLNMVFSELKSTTLKPQKEKKLLTFSVAFLVAASLFLPYIFMDNGYFLFYGDYNVQQIPFYMHCHEAIKNGNIFWDFGTDLGANFIGSYSFYLLGSPFFWFTLLFPTSFVPYLVAPLLMLKFAFAALTGYLFIRRFTKTPLAASLGGLMYAFSGFSIYNIFYNHFHEALIVFPLLLLSIELLLTENKRFFFALMVMVAAITNYFFFFGMVIFIIIYFFVRLFSGAIEIKASRFFAFAFEAVLGLTLSAIVLLPSILAIIDNSRVSSSLIGWNAIMYGKEQIYANILQCFFFPPDIPARPVFFPYAEVQWSSLGGWLPLFSTVGIFTLFAKKKNHWLKRLIGICIFMALVPILNSAFYAFNTAYYARWFYMPVLMISLASVTLAEDCNIDWSYGYKWVLGITIAITLVIGFFPQKNSNGELIYGLYTQSSDNTYVIRYWITCAISIISLIVLGFLLKLIKSNPKAFFKSAIACVCIITVVYGNVFISSGRSHSYDIQTVMIDSLIEGDVDLNDDSNYRIDVYEGVDNTGMYLGYSTINAFHSIIPASVMEFYEYIGIERSVASRPDTTYAAIRPLLSVKYLLDPKDDTDFLISNNQTEMAGYKYLNTQDNYYIYENENYIPYGFSYEYYMSYDFCNSYPQKDRAALMLKAILLTDEQIEKYGSLFKNIEELEPEISENLDFIEEPEYSEDDLPIVDYDNTEETIDSTVLDTTNAALKYDSEKLAKTSASTFETDKYGFTATVERDKKALVFFSIPYDEGWSATVNGEKAKIEKVNAGFMAVRVPKGESTICFNYTTPGLQNGILITIASAGIFILYIIIFLVYNHNRIGEENYPEGNELLCKWSLEEVDDEKEDTPKQSLLDDIPDIDIPSINNGFEGGFKINTNIDE